MAHQSDLIAQDIHAYLKSQEEKDLLRFITCGSVDDGKSTLIGRLLFDSKLIFEDQLAAVTADSKKVGTQGGEIDLALLVDGLQAEREQGITIDVAYRFFSTDKRKFIVADTPGIEDRRGIGAAVAAGHDHDARRLALEPEAAIEGCLMGITVIEERAIPIHQTLHALHPPASLLWMPR